MPRVPPVTRATLPANDPAVRAVIALPPGRRRRPASTPLTYEARSPARKATAAATSSASRRAAEREGWEGLVRGAGLAAHEVDAHAARAELVGHRPRHALERAAAGIAGQTAPAGLVVDERVGDEDDAAAAAARDHETGGALGDAERRPQVAAERGVERRLVAVEQRAGGADREVGDGDVEAAEHAQQLAQRGLDLARPRGVGGDAVDGGAGGLELGLGHPRLLLVGRADDARRRRPRPAGGRSPARRRHRRRRRTPPCP